MFSLIISKNIISSFKYMKKFLFILSAVNFILSFNEVSKANEYQFITGSTTGSRVTFSGVESDGTSTILNSFDGAGETIGIDIEDGIYDEYHGKAYFTTHDFTNGNRTYYLLEYDLVNNTFKKLSNAPTADMILYPKGVTQMINKKPDGSIHIGENSAVFKEENGREKFWAQDANGKSIPIDITNGSKLLINGRDVEQSINNVGALSAALTGLPTVPSDTTLACGLGTGTHGGDFAFSGGCASKVNEKLSINYAASITMPGQDYAGDFEDQFSARAGFVWKLGKSNKPTQISMQAKEQMEDKINSLEVKNEKILSKNQKLENKVSTLLARLERLEKVALSESKSKNLATIKLP